MLKLIKMAWRNMWRNWRRTAIATTAIVLGLILVVDGEEVLIGEWLIAQRMIGSFSPARWRVKLVASRVRCSLTI